MTAIPASEPAEPNYTMGYSKEFHALLERRNAPAVAGHLLPHLKPGMRVLDFGCGPGTISVGLATAVAPGTLHGIDMEASQVEMARAAALGGGHDNAQFEVGTVESMPFEDGYFDAAHCHAVLSHVPDTAAALAEVRRVLKSGGIVSSRELITASSFFEPDPSGDLGEAWKTFTTLLAANGGHPQIGREMKGRLAAAGFSIAHVSASFECYSSAVDVEFFHQFVSGWFFAEETMEGAVRHGVAAREDFARWRGRLDEWKQQPGAFASIAWGETIGRKE